MSKKIDQEVQGWQQNWSWEKSQDVTKAMQAAGRNPLKRAAVGAKAALHNKVASIIQGMYPGSDRQGTTKLSMLLRLMGDQKTAMWIDRFFGKPKDKKTKAPTEQKQGGSSGGLEVENLKVAITHNTAILKGVSARLDILSDTVKTIAEDVTDIKSLLMPKNIVAKGAAGTPAADQFKFVQFNPLAPQGENYREVTETGKLTNRKPGKDYMASAIQKAAMASATLALKIEKKDREKGELRKKYQYKDTMEQVRKGDPIALLRKDMEDNFEKVFGILAKNDKKLEEVKEGQGDSLSENILEMVGLMRVLGGLMPLAKWLGKAGLVGIAGYLGFKVGSWLNEKFKLSEKINDLIDSVLGKFGKGNEAKAKEATKTDTWLELQEKTNKKLEGSGFTLVEPGKYMDAEGVIHDAKDLPEPVRKDFNERGLKGFGEPAEEAKPEATAVAAPEVTPAAEPKEPEEVLLGTRRQATRRRPYYTPDQKPQPKISKPEVPEGYGETPAPQPTALPAPAVAPVATPSAPPPIAKAPTKTGGVEGELRKESDKPVLENIPSGTSNGKKLVEDAMNAAGISGAHRASLLAQIHHESNGFKAMAENLNYSADGLQKTFGKYFKNRQEAEAYARNPEKIANKVYGGRMGNGPESSGDGYRYRGRGFIQLTGKDNYRQFGDIIGMDLVKNPDLAMQPAIAAKIAVAYYKKRVIDKGIRADDLKSVTKAVNGGTIGLEDRGEKFAMYSKEPSSTVSPSRDTMVASTTSTPKPAPGIQGASMDGEARKMEAARVASTSTPAPVVINAPTNNNMQASSGGPKTPLPKGSATSKDDSWVRVANRDTKHPIYG